MGFAKPKVVVSRCLGFFACRYNGQMLHDDFVDRMRPHVSFVPICPEAEIGLGTPRFPLRMALGKNNPILIQPATGADVTQRMDGFAGRFLASLGEVDGFLLKNRSPSCGISDVRIYNKASADAGVAQKGAGAFGAAAIKSFGHLAIEDEGRLKNFRIREHFLSKLFALAKLRRVKSMGGLVEFHSRNKFLIMGYGQGALRALGNIAANRAGAAQAVNDYALAMGNSMQRPPSRPAVSNVLMHMLGFFSKTLSANEKRFFMETLSLYREGRIPYSSALSVIRAWAIRENSEYLLAQSLFNPYPAELAELSDAGKPLDI